MIYDSHQGTQLSAGQRLRMQQQQQVRAFMNPILSDSINQTLKTIEVRKEQGAKPWIDPNKFNICEQSSKGTPSVAEWMGY